GRTVTEGSSICSHDHGCVATLKNTHTNDTLSPREHPDRLPRIDFPQPIIEMGVHAAARADEEKLQAGLHKLHEEDPTFQTHYNSETHETIISGVGERHLEISLAKLRRKYGVQAQLTRPKIAYRETLKAQAEGQGKHKKQ